MLQALSFLMGLFTAAMAFAATPTGTLKEETFYLYGQKFTVHRSESSTMPIAIQTTMQNTGIICSKQRWLKW